MIKINRIVSLLLALSLLGALLAGCAGSSADRCVKVEGDTISIPSMRISFSFPAPWFVVTDEELDAISQNKDLLNDYVDVEGNLIHSRPETYTAEQVLLLNGMNTVWKALPLPCLIGCRRIWKKFLCRRLGALGNIRAIRSVLCPRILPFIINTIIYMKKALLWKSSQADIPTT